MTIRTLGTGLLGVIGAACALGAVDPASAQITITPPAPYVQVRDHAAFGVSGRVGVTYFLEDFEDGLLNTPGVSADPSASVVSGDSVDLDDGLLDGIGLGKCLANSTTGVITLQFNSGTLGGFPNRVGVVWTNGASNTAVTITVLDGANQLASQPFFPIGDNGPAGSTAEDRLFVVESPNGIQSLQIADSGGTIQIDHVQYSAPTPGTLFVRDFMNNDAKSDLVWHNANTGGVALWYMDGLVRNGGGPASQAPSATWVPQGLGDLNGDGKADVVWRDSLANTMHVWLMDGQTVISSSQVQNANAVGAALQVIAVADVNGDKKADIVFRNVNTGALNVWFMDGNTRTSGGAVAGANTLGYTYAGTGDLNGDGRFDLVFRNDTTGFVWGMLLNGLTPIAFQTVGNAGSIPSFWSLQAAGDLDGDGRADLIWRNLNTGVVNGWLMDGLYRRSGGQMGTIPLTWTLRAAADLNGDGKADLVWTNANEQKVNGWLMDGLVRTAGGTIQNLSPAWNLVNR